MVCIIFLLPHGLWTSHLPPGQLTQGCESAAFLLPGLWGLLMLLLRVYNIAYLSNSFFWNSCLPTKRFFSDEIILPGFHSTGNTPVLWQLSCFVTVYQHASLACMTQNVTKAKWHILVPPIPIRWLLAIPQSVDMEVLSEELHRPTNWSPALSSLPPVISLLWWEVLKLMTL